MAASAGIAIGLYGISQSERAYRGSKKSEALTKEDIRKRNKLRRIKSARERKKFAAEVTSAQAEVIIAGGGAIDSSALEGARSSIAAQAAERIGFARIEEQLSMQGTKKPKKKKSKVFRAAARAGTKAGSELVENQMRGTNVRVGIAGPSTDEPTTQQPTVARARQDIFSRTNRGGTA